MNILIWVFLALAIIASLGFIYQMRKAQQAVVDVSQAQAKAEAELRTERERLLGEAEKEAAKVLNRGQREADAVRKEAELKA